MKKIIAVSLSGVLISSRAWKEAHEIGMKEHFDNLGISGDSGDKDYFNVVDKSIAKSWPELSAEDRVAKRRRIYLDRVLSLIKDEDIRRDAVEFFRGLKKDYRLILITTNDKEAADEVLDRIGAKDLFDEIFVSELSEKNDKMAVFDRMMGKIGKVDVLIEKGGKLEDVCLSRGIVYLKFDCEADSLNELQGKIIQAVG